MKFMFAFLFLLITPLPLMAQSTLPYFDGVAIIDGFHISDEDILIFDKPEGRVIEISLWCTENCPDEQTIRRFYNDNLIAMGWENETNGGYTNDKARLSLDILSDPSTNGTIILFRSNG